MLVSSNQLHVSPSDEEHPCGEFGKVRDLPAPNSYQFTTEPSALEGMNSRNEQAAFLKIHSSSNVLDTQMALADIKGRTDAKLTFHRNLSMNCVFRHLRR